MFNVQFVIGEVIDYYFRAVRAAALITMDRSVEFVQFNLWMWKGGGRQGAFGRVHLTH